MLSAYLLISLSSSRVIFSVQLEAEELGPEATWGQVRSALGSGSRSPGLGQVGSGRGRLVQRRLRAKLDAGCVWKRPAVFKILVPAANTEWKRPKPMGENHTKRS